MILGMDSCSWLGVSPAVFQIRRHPCVHHQSPTRGSLRRRRHPLRLKYFLNGTLVSNIVLDTQARYFTMRGIGNEARMYARKSRLS